ncbi:MAG: TolC family protein [Limisphaerales bacterium]
MRQVLFAVGILVAALVPATAQTPAARTIDLQECIALALEKNLDLRIERYNPELALFNLAAARAGYEPVLSASATKAHDESGSRLFSGGFLIPGAETDTRSISGSLGGLTPWGMSYRLRTSANEQYGRSFTFDTNINAIVANPFDSTAGSVGIELTQPLLKNLWIDSTRLNIAVAKNRLQQSELGFKARLLDVVTRVELAYYDLEFAHASVQVQQKGLELAERLLEENRKRVEVGALAPLDEKQSEAEVAARQADLIAAQRNLGVLENALKQLIGDDFAAWNGQALVPAGALSAERRLLNLQESWERGLTSRPDLLQTRLELERQGIQLKYDRNQIYPQLDLVASFGYNGSGVEFGDAYREMRERDRPYHSYGAVLSIPLGNGSARNRFKATRAGREQTLLELKKIEQDVMIAIDNAIKLAQANWERIQATRKATEFAEAALAAEQKKLENGKSTSFVVLQLQRNLTAARSDEISALVQYKRALAQLDQAEASTLERRKIDVTVR